MNESFLSAFRSPQWFWQPSLGSGERAASKPQVGVDAAGWSRQRDLRRRGLVLRWKTPVQQRAAVAALMMMTSQCAWAQVALDTTSAILPISHGSSLVWHSIAACAAFKAKSTNSGSFLIDRMTQGKWKSHSRRGGGGHEG